MKLNFTMMLMCIAVLFSSFTAFAQSQSPLNIALAEVEKNHTEWNLSASDVVDMYVSDLVVDKNTGLSRVYFQQRHAAIKVNQAILNVSIDAQGNVFHVGKRFTPNLNTKINTSIPALSAEQALTSALVHLEIVPSAPLQLKEALDARKVIFDKGDFAKKDITVELQYQVVNETEVRLAWDMVVDGNKDTDRWSMRLDAQTGEVIAQENWTIYCRFEHDHFHNHDAHCNDAPLELGTVNQALTTQSAATTTMLSADDAQYNVFAIPLESPAHGDRTLIQNPAWLTASPYGWHDTNGVDGAEYTITRGNNVWAWLDRDDNQTSAGDEPDGGADLIFDFPWNEDMEPEEYPEASTTNLFYMTNIMHDFAYAMGMDEASGNFQQNTYGNGGIGNDAIDALAQASADVGSTNNAFYSHANDGNSPSINMFVWNEAGGGAEFLRVDAPSNISGTYQTGTADWGQQITNTNGVTGEVAIVNDNEFSPYTTDACEELVNGAEIAGKIALIDRGGCEFGSKALEAENNGAIGVIICNFEDDIINMAAGQDGGSVTIPVVFIQATDCANIRLFAGDGLEVTLVAPVSSGPAQLDGDFDNGIIAHEYGHGVSIRLTGGGNSACLGNAENMGEGWSDFLGLVLSVREGDTGDMRRGVGTFVSREENDGRGIRRFPYSNDMTISPLTYGDVAGNPATHPLGEVWCNMIWDLYWAFVDEYGWDADVYEGTGGNNMAVRLVFEGMKTQPCQPGFVDGRDAILAADMALNGGANQCLIWEVFARRGCGYYADQGSPDNGSDQIEDFEPLPTCIKELKIAKAVTGLVNAGDDINVTIDVINHKESTATNVVITDVMPEGTTYKAGSSNLAEGVVNGNMVSFDLGDMATLDEIQLTYQLETDAANFSIQYFLDDLENQNAENFWIFDNITDSPNPWTISNGNQNSGTYSFFVEDVAEETQQAFFNIQTLTIEGDNPVLRFYHSYNTEAGADAGIIEVSLDGLAWSSLPTQVFKGGYNGTVQYGTFVVPNLQAFSGNSGGWIGSYVDLSEYSGEELRLRWRFGTDDNTPGFGWFVDDIELMDMVNYVSEACVTSNEGDMACDTPDERGTIVESQLVSATFEPVNENLSVAIYPNPATDLIHVHLNTSESSDVEVALFSVDGRQLLIQNVKAIGEMNIPIQISSLSEGFYFVRVSANGSTFTEKVIIGK